MAIRYDENTKARAVRLVREHVDDYQTEWAAIKAIAGRLGMSAETLRRWVRQAGIDAGAAAGVSSGMDLRIVAIGSSSVVVRGCRRPPSGLPRQEGQARIPTLDPPLAGGAMLGRWRCWCRSVSSRR